MKRHPAHSKRLLQFIFIVCTLFLSAATVQAAVSDGYYILVPKCSKTRSVSVKGSSKSSGANVYLYKNKSAANQIFFIENLEDGSCMITNKNSCLVLEAAGTKNKANVRQALYRGKSTQKWKITKSGSYYVIKNAASGKALTVKGSKNKNKTNIYVNKYKKSSGQLFTLKLVAAATKKKATASSGALITSADSEDDIILFTSDTDVSETKNSAKTVNDYPESSRKWKESDYTILTNIIGAVESGGQVYGNRNYAAYAGPASATANELTVTLGWAQYYGYEGQRLVQNIYNKDPKAFLAIDKKKQIVKALKKDWVATRWNPSEAEKQLLISLITSKAGKACQDELFKSYMKSYVADCKQLYTDNAWAIVMYCEIRHLGGPNAAKRIFDKCGSDFSLNNIMSMLKEDQADGSSSTQVGDSLFWSRHVKCCEFLVRYAK